jgi:hypothetical protein
LPEGYSVGLKTIGALANETGAAAYNVLSLPKSLPNTHIPERCTYGVTTEFPQRESRRSRLLQTQDQGPRPRNNHLDKALLEHSPCGPPLNAASGTRKVPSNGWSLTGSARAYTVPGGPTLFWGNHLTRPDIKAPTIMIVDTTAPLLSKQSIKLHKYVRAAPFWVFASEPEGSSSPPVVPSSAPDEARRCRTVHS